MTQEPVSLPDRLPRGAWGKADRSGRFHALEAHSMDVAVVFEGLCGLPVLQSRLANLAGRDLAAEDVRRLSALVYLHDLGKLMPGFQAKARPDLRCSPDLDHSAFGDVLLRQAAHDPRHPLAPLVLRIMEWSPGVGELMLAIFAHHGRPIRAASASARIPVVPGYDIAGAMRLYLDMFDCAFPDLTDAAPLPDRPPFVHLIAGLAALADWIGSDRRFFAFVARPDSGYPAQSRRCADLALRAIGLDIGGRAPATAFQDIAGGSFQPRPAQALVGACDPVESALVLLEAETGSGKTEAALWRYALLHAAGLVSGLYFAVPTRSAARQLHRRVNAAMQRMFGADAPEAVLAIPGQMLAGEAAGLRLPDFETLWDDAPGPHPTRWAAEHATRFLASTVAVGTVDQAMLASLQVKHAHLRGAALSRSLLVIDEVHSSDLFMTEVLSQLLRDHLRAGGQAMLMSATLGSRARSLLLETPLPALGAAIAAPYPALWSKGHDAPAAARTEGNGKAVSMERVSTMDPADAARRAIAMAQQGARVLVIRNTVKAASETFDAVIAEGAGDLLLQVEGGPALHHSRFAAEDRVLLDRAVEERLGPRKDRPRHGAIVLGSQTLEQSLDIDADVLISDLCPVDVLLQRLGRLHRHDLPRPAGFERPHCLVLCPEFGLDPLALPSFVNGLGAWRNRDGTLQGIYMDLACLSLTERLIAERPLWNIPAMNRDLVERATHPEACEAETARRGQAWQRYQADLVGRGSAQRGLARSWVLRRDERFPDSFPGEEEHIQTRLGAQGPLLTFAPGTLGPFGTPIRSLALPAHWSHGVTPDDAVLTEREADGLRFVVGGTAFLYGRKGLQRVREGG